MLTNRRKTHILDCLRREGHARQNDRQPLERLNLSMP